MFLRCTFAGTLLTLAFIVSVAGEPALPLKVSENHRYLVQATGRPFFYLGDTAWELFHRLNREQADAYLADRARKGFTVIEAVALAEFNGLTEPNRYGHLPFTDQVRPGRWKPISNTSITSWTRPPRSGFTSDSFQPGATR